MKKDELPNQQNKEEGQLPKDLNYDPREDIYNQAEKYELVEDKDSLISKNNNQETGDDLDIPGAELDDEQEMIGEEDEENNYYSLGGDNHNDLDEDNG